MVFLKIYQFFSSRLKFTMIYFFQIFDEFLQNDKKCHILKLIDINRKIATADLHQIAESSFQVIQFIPCE